MQKTLPKKPRLESVRHYRRGTKVTIEKSAVKKDKMEIHLKEAGGSKTKVRFKFDKDLEAYNPADRHGDVCLYFC